MLTVEEARKFAAWGSFHKPKEQRTDRFITYRRSYDFVIVDIDLENGTFALGVEVGNLFIGTRWEPLDFTRLINLSDEISKAYRELTL